MPVVYISQIRLCTISNTLKQYVYRALNNFQQTLFLKCSFSTPFKFFCLLLSVVLAQLCVILTVPLLAN